MTEESSTDLEAYARSWLLVQEMKVNPSLIVLVDLFGELSHHPAHLEHLSTKEHKEDACGWFSVVPRPICLSSTSSWNRQREPQHRGSSVHRSTAAYVYLSRGGASFESPWVDSFFEK